MAPADGDTVSANPVLTWGPVSGATKYHVQVATDAGFSSTVYDQRTVELLATPDRDLPAGTLYWRVSGSDSTNNDGPFSDTSSFTKDPGSPPSLISPADLATVHYPDNPAVFSWNPVPGAKSYTLEVDDADDFIGEKTYTTANTSYTLAEPQTVGQTFYWRVSATFTEGASSGPSETRSYTEAWASKPSLLAPANTVLTSVTDVMFRWEPVAGASGYQLQVSPNGDWANNVTIDTSLPNALRSTSYSPPTTLDNGSYFWRVRAIDAASTPNFGEWSDEWQFTRGWVAPDPSTSPDKVTLLAPQWDAADPNAIPHVPGSLGLSWSPIRHASHYEIEISTDINFSPLLPATEQCYTNHTTFSPYTRVTGTGEPGLCEIGGLSSGTVYYWHVRAIDAPKGVLGVWSNTGNSDTFRFIVDPTMPQPTGPANGLPTTTPNLEWQAVQGAEKYRVWVVKQNGDPVSGSPFTTYATSYTPKTLAAADGPFRWYVAAIDANGDISEVPAVPDQWTFSLSAPTTSSTLTLTTPADGASSIRMPAMTWSAVTGATDYVVHYGAHGSESLTPLGKDLSFTSFTYPDVTLVPDTYFWYVEAHTAQGSVYSAEGTFVISPLNVLGSADYLSPAKCVLPAGCTPVTDTPTLTWSAAPGAGLYEVTIANDANFTNVLRTYTTAYTSLTPRESLVDNQAGQAFYWFVRPCVDAGRTRCGPGAQDDTANNNASAFQKRSKAITLMSPADNTTQPNVITFRWTDFLDTNGGSAPIATQEAKQYEIQVSTVSDFATTLDTATVDQAWYTPYSKTYPEGPLYWRVQAIDGSGNHLTWSAVREVTKSSPATTLDTPSAGAKVGGAPALSWNGQDYAAKYAVEVYKNGDLTFAPVNKVAGASTTAAKFTAWAPTIGLASGSYAWRVRAIDGGGQPGQWSAGRLFTVQSAAPTLLTPSESSGSQESLLFSWSTPNDHRAVKYTWQLSSTSAFSSLTASKTTVMTAWAPTSAIQDGAYYWRVLVLDASGNVIATSAFRSLSLDAKAPTVTAKSPTSSASLTGAFQVTFSESVQHVSGSTFKVTVAGTSTNVPGTVTASPTTAKFTPSAPLVPGQQYTAKLSSGITDEAGNALSPYSWTVRTDTIVENTSVAMRETWDRDVSSHASNGAYDSSATAGSSARFTFTGTNVTLLGAQEPGGGYADVYLDGVKKRANLSFYSSTTRWQQSMWSASGLGNVKHTVQVRVLGTHSGSSTGSWVHVDAFKVGSTLYQESNSTVREAFRRVNTGSAGGGSYDTASHTTSGDTGGRPSYTATFAGTRVTLYALRSPSSGAAAVYIDGVRRSSVDLHSSTTMYKYPVYTSPTLSGGTHTIRVEVVGTKSGKNSTVAVDYFRVA
jgi:hypothetical protein